MILTADTPGLVSDQNGVFAFSSIPNIHGKMEHWGQNPGFSNCWIFSIPGPAATLPKHYRGQFKRNKHTKGRIIAQDCTQQDHLSKSLGHPTFSLSGCDSCVET